MTWGGTNWGNLGHPGGYTSYDYAAVISEERLVDREKYSEAKLEANFIQASPAYLTAQYQNNTNINARVQQLQTDFAALRDGLRELRDETNTTISEAQALFDNAVDCQTNVINDLRGRFEALEDKVLD